jgi:hypothetical protein
MSSSLTLELVSSFNINAKAKSSLGIRGRTTLNAATINMATITVMTTVTTAVSATATVARAPAQAGVFEGLNPTIYNPADPVILFIIQASLVIALTRLLYRPLAKI